MGHVPAEFHSIKVEFGEPSAVTHGGGTGKVVAAGLGRLCHAVGRIDVGAVRVGLHGYGHVLVEFCLGGKVDILVGGISRVEIAVKIAAVVKVYVTVQFDIQGEGKRCGREGDGQNEFAHKILPKKFLDKR